MKRIALIALLSFGFGCSSDSNTADLPGITVPKTDPFDTNKPDADAGDPNGPLVNLNLDPYLDGAVDANDAVTVYQVETTDQLLTGPVALGRVGDWILENGKSKFLIEGPTRNMNPCPHGGNVLDAALKTADGETEDIVGEICMLYNVGLTMKPETYEIIETGRPDVGVLAVTGAFQLGDYINIKSMILDFAPFLAGQIELDTETLVPARITVYYVLRGGENGLRVLSAFRNDGPEQIDLTAVHLVSSGGDGYYFNPSTGFGSSGGLLDGTPLPLLAFNGTDSSYAFVPKVNPDLIDAGDLPTGGSYVVISGVAASLLNVASTSLVPTLVSSTEDLKANPGLLHIAPGATELVEYWHYVGDGSLSTMLDHAYENVLELETVLVTGTVLDENNMPVEGARVSATETGTRKTFNQAKTNSAGEYELAVRSGIEVTMSARVGRRPSDQTETITPTAAVVSDLTIAAESKIRVTVKRPDGSVVPARLSVTCVGDCQDLPTSKDEDVDYHNLPSQFAAVEWGGIDGVVEAVVPGGYDYRVAISRGMEWSIWPQDALSTQGTLVTVAVGETIELDAEIEHVVDSSGSVSGDFHIHTIASPDSTVPHIDRVKNFMSEGVDIIVSTDHDIITDFAPAIATLGAGSWIQSVVGEEITTSDLGHYNAFPMTESDENRRGGAIDWGGGDSFNLVPSELFARIKEESPSTAPVIQVNHAEGLGLVNGAKADVLRGLTLGQREPKRLPPAENPIEGDSQLWDDGFTAMELLNGNSRERFWVLSRWWMAMIARGYVTTGTGVTDTHKLFSDLGGVPRSYVFVGANDTPDTFVESEFTEAINAQRVVGTNGPYLEIALTNSDGATVGLGETIATVSEMVTAEVTIDVPNWIDVNEIQVFMNVSADEIDTGFAGAIDDPIPPTMSVPVVWDASHDIEVSTGTLTHSHRRQTVTIPLSTTDDAFVIFVVTGANSMWPVVGAQPFAFTNPVLIDADGNGYDNPPLKALSEMPPVQAHQIGRACEHHDAMKKMTSLEEQIRYVATHLSCSH